MKDIISSEVVYWVVEANIKPGELNNFKALMNEMVDACRENEPDALIYEWSISKDEKQCHIYERYADSAAALNHLSRFVENFGERFGAVVDLGTFNIYGNPNDEAANAFVDGFDAALFAPIGGFTR
jgi:quinol monooxygenase YgiN